MVSHHIKSRENERTGKEEITCTFPTVDGTVYIYYAEKVVDNNNKYFDLCQLCQTQNYLIMYISMHST